MRRLIVWRHGNTDWNAGDRVQGQIDVPLNDYGRHQASRSAEILAGYRPVAIVSSDLERAAETAAPLATLTGLPVRYDARLRERNFGAWQGLLISEVARTRPEEYARWRSGADEIGGGVETRDELSKRVADALEEAAALAQAGGTVVVSTHGGAARQGIGHLLGWPVEMLRTLRPLQNCHWIDMAHDERRGWQMAAYNVGVFDDVVTPPPV